MFSEQAGDVAMADTKLITMVRTEPGRMLSTLSEHVRIMDAIDAGNPEAARKAASDHVQLLGDQLTDFISSLPVDMSRAH